MAISDGGEAARTRGATDAGGAGDKVSFPDPSASPLGTDDEAAGTKPQSGSPAGARTIGSDTTRHMEPSPGRPTAVTGESARPMSGLDLKAGRSNRAILIGAFVVLVIAAIAIVLWPR